MGADLYIEPIFSQNKRKAKKNFNRAVKARDSLGDYRELGLGEVEKFVRVKLNMPEKGFDDPAPLIPENMELPRLLESKRDVYNAHVKAQARVTKWYNKMYEVGYFRDSYNGTSLFWRLGMSWWQCPYIKDGEISPDNAKKLLAEVQEKELPPLTWEELKENHCSVDEGKNSVDSWNQFFLDKKERFCAFLQEAIDKGLTITALV